jgi:hypothetical protein
MFTNWWKDVTVGLGVRRDTNKGLLGNKLEDRD